MSELIKIPELSNEQKDFIGRALNGKNVLVEACIGSGKTTAIQALCDALPKDKKILYLTYNKLLKLDAKSKIKNKNVTVTNYHGFAYSVLVKNGIRVGISDLVQKFNQLKPNVKGYSTLIIDEYQDIEQELADMLEHIKASNPDIQIIAVGDIKQKIYDKTNLDVEKFIDEFLDDYDCMEFTRCFRLSADIAAMLGRVWEKDIVGVNTSCKVSKMDFDDAVQYIEKHNPCDILCLGQRNGAMAHALNQVEHDMPRVFNKHTVYASIRSSGETGTGPKQDSAIFTTYDGSKGLERKICFIFDYTESYWLSRASKPAQSYEILRNIFCVAASRGKEEIIFVDDGDGILSEQTLSTVFNSSNSFMDMDISKMFDFKYKEDIEDCFKLITVQKRSDRDTNTIQIKGYDSLIDLSPCIDIYQKAIFFNQFSIDTQITDINAKSVQEGKLGIRYNGNDNLDSKILKVVAHETDQQRYSSQVIVPFVPETQRIEIVSRLSSEFHPDEDVQKECSIDFYNDKGILAFIAKGRCDIVKDNTVYELKFVQELSHEHFLECACYMIALGLKKGVLWNTCTNEMYDIIIPNKAKFLNVVAKTITKGAFARYYKKKSHPTTIALPETKSVDLSSLIEGQCVEHKSYGIGSICRLTDDYIIVDFASGGTKVLSRTACEKEGFLKAVS